MSELTLFSSDTDVKNAIRKVLGVYPLSHNMRWELEVQRRKLSQYEEDMRTAKSAYTDLFNEENGKHEKAFREAKSKYKSARKSWICAIEEAREALKSASVLDMEAINKEGEYEAAYENGDCEYEEESDGEISTFRFLCDVPKGTAEYVRNKALRAARRRHKNECRHVRNHCVKLYRGRLSYARYAARPGIDRANAVYKKEVSEIEETYYQARLNPTRHIDTDAITSSGSSSV